MLQSIRRGSNHGGSSKVVKDVASELGRRGHAVDLLCAAASDNRDPFELAPGVRVLPVLPFRESWQDTWLVPPADLSRIITTVVGHAARAHRIVVFDAHFLYPDVLPGGVPTIWSLRDLVYVQALQGAMGFRRDLLVAPSEYIRQAFLDATRGWLPGVEHRVTAIRNGVDLDRFRRVDPTTMRAELGVGQDPILLFPHRPEAEKGIEMALELCLRLNATGTRVRLVIPRGTDVMLLPEARTFYDGVEARAAALGVGSHVVLCDWVTPERMPELYAAAAVTLCLGNIVEASSNSALESLACGTPVVASAIACFHEFPDEITKVPVDDLPAGQAALERLLAVGAATDPEKVRDKLRTGHDHVTMLERFCSVIEQARVRPPLRARAVSRATAKVPIWLSVQHGELYDEYRKTRLSNSALSELWSEHGHREFDVAATALPPEELDALVARGSLVFTS